MHIVIKCGTNNLVSPQESSSGIKVGMLLQLKLAFKLSLNSFSNSVQQ
jgi:hypothetical protein